MALADAVPFAVSAWALDEASGTRVDQVGSNDLTDNNTVASATGQFGDGADFEADNSESLSVVHHADLAVANNKFTIRFWIKLESHLGFTTRVVLCKGVGTSNFEYRLILSNVGGDTRPTFQVKDTAPATVTVAALNFGFNMAVGTWYLIHCWHDPDADVIGIAVNAGTADTAAITTGVRTDLTSAFNLGNDGNAAQFMDGMLDDVVLLKGYVLDATERSEDYNSGTGVVFADWDGGGGNTYDETGAGGVTIGGAGDVQATYSIAGDGEVVIGGEGVLAAATYDETGSGGGVLGGSGDVSAVYSQLGSGGATAGGTGVVQATLSQAGSGGAIVGGAGDVQATYSIAGAGQVTIGGAGLLGASTYDETGSGGASIGGAGDVSATYTLTGSGGALLAGTGDVQFVGSQVGSGAVTLAGSGDVQALYSQTGVGGVVIGGEGEILVGTGATGPMYSVTSGVCYEHRSQARVCYEHRSVASVVYEHRSLARQLVEG